MFTLSGDIFCEMHWITSVVLSPSCALGKIVALVFDVNKSMLHEVETALRQLSQLTVCVSSP